MAIYLEEKGEYACLFNSSPHSVTYSPNKTNKYYQTAEHLFQSLKFELYRPEIARRLRTSSKLREKADRFKDDIRPDWFMVYPTMLEISLHRKFLQHRKPRRKLKDTGDRELISNILDKDGNENLFGRTLMKVRRNLRQNSQVPPLPPIPKPVIFSNCNCKSCKSHGFSTFSKHPIKFLNSTYPTAGHLFQAFKFSGHQSLLNQILGSTTAEEVSAIAKANKGSCRRDWKKIRIPTMRYIIWLKFTQHVGLFVKLLATTGRELIEKEPSTDDSSWEWGEGVNGKEQLAKALMWARGILTANRNELAVPEVPEVPPQPPRIMDSDNGDCCCILM